MDNIVKESNFNLKQVQDFIFKKLDHIFHWQIGLMQGFKFDNYVAERNKLISLFPKELIELINKADIEHLFAPELTVEVTTKKKGKVIIADEYHKSLINTLIEIPEKYHPLIHYKQILSGNLFAEFGFHIKNTKPQTFCCDGLKNQFKFCEQDGLNCPDYFVRCNVHGELYVDASNATYALSNCPFCGVKVNDKENQRQGRVLMID
jgi:hypothetical protein